MVTPGLPSYDKYFTALCGMTLLKKYANERAKREYPIAPKLGDYFLSSDQQAQSKGATTENLDKETFSQLMVLKFGPSHEATWTIVLHCSTTSSLRLRRLSQYLCMTGGRIGHFLNRVFVHVSLVNFLGCEKILFCRDF